MFTVVFIVQTFLLGVASPLAVRFGANFFFRGRLNISDENYSIASRIISDTIAAKYIKLDDATASSKKYARYVPFWV